MEHSSTLCHIFIEEVSDLACK